MNACRAWKTLIVAGLGLVFSDLIVGGELRSVARSPAEGASRVCPDTPLRITFATAPAIGLAGLIQVIDTTSGAVVESIDVAVPTATQSIGGLDGYSYRPVTVEGDSATIHLRNGALARGRTYAVAIGAGVFVAGEDRFEGDSGAAAWRFTTRADAPAADASRLVVAADGTGDFCTVQGAFDFLPKDNRRPVTVFVRRGVYTEILCLLGKHAITLSGEDRKGTIIGYPNNANFNASGGNPYADAGNPSAANPYAGGKIYRRGAFLAHQCEDLVITNLTLRNTTPQGGSQAEAVILNGSLTARAIIKDVDFFSYQDTVQINGQAFVTGCHVEGDVDFLWGTGPSYFEACTFRSLRSDAFFSQVRSPATNHGFVFRRCTFEGAPGVTGNFLTRVEPVRFPHSEVVLVDCVLGEVVIPVGWQLQRAKGATVEPAPGNVRFWEFNSRTPAGDPVDVSQRLVHARQLRVPEDAEVIARYRDPVWVLGGDWDPRVANPVRPAP